MPKTGQFKQKEKQTDNATLQGIQKATHYQTLTLELLKDLIPAQFFIGAPSYHSPPMTIKESLLAAIRNKTNDLIQQTLDLYPHMAQDCIHAAVNNNNMAILKLLIEQYHVNVDLPDIDGQTPLFSASTKLNLEAIKYLLAQGADVNAPSRMVYGTVLQTTLCSICAQSTYSENYAEIIRTLVKSGATVEDRNGFFNINAAEYLRCNIRDPEILQKYLQALQPPEPVNALCAQLAGLLTSPVRTAQDEEMPALEPCSLPVLTQWLSITAIQPDEREEIKGVKSPLSPSSLRPA